MNKTQNRTAQSQQIHDLVILSIFIAIIFLLAFTPIGLIDLPLIKATILHVPVIIGAILLGPKKGAFLG
ncbi:MAG: ECF transporter S component, partial [Oscillospiraceae bacterium]